MKERLTGAIILVVLIVLLVPELLSGPSHSAPVPQMAATSAEEAPLRSYTINLADESHTTAVAAPTSTVHESSGPAQPAAIIESPTPQQTATTPPTESTVEQTDGSVPPAASTTATEPQDVTEEQPSTQRNAAAPAATAPPAQPDESLDKPATQERAAAPAPARSSPMGDWMVQLGVFRNHANAERLAQQLKGQGFHVLISASGSGGHPIWRVRAGPVAERALAEQLSARLRTAGHVGSVVPK